MQQQESRINQQMDSQVKRTLARAIEYEQNKKELESLRAEVERLKEQELRRRSEALGMYSSVKKIVDGWSEDTVGKRIWISKLNWFAHAFNINK